MAEKEEKEESISSSNVYIRVIDFYFLLETKTGTTKVVNTDEQERE